MSDHGSGTSVYGNSVGKLQRQHATKPIQDTDLATAAKIRCAIYEWDFAVHANPRPHR